MMLNVAAVALLTVLACTSSVVGAESSDVCDPTGTWSQDTRAYRGLPYHRVEISADSSPGTFLVQTTINYGVPRPGYQTGNNFSFPLLGDVMPTVSPFAASSYPNNKTGGPAPACTSLPALGWCKYPYCPNAEPEEWPAWPTVYPPCAINAPCPPPTWAPTYQLNLSLVAQPCNASGYFTEGHRYGLLSFDWNNARDVWSLHSNDSTNCSQMLVEQARRVKMINPDTRVMIYRNLELALEWLESERAAMYDASKADFFLHYQTDPNKGQIYDEPKEYGSQYFWNFSNPKAVEYWIENVVLGELGVGSPYVDGVYTDDVRGVFGEHPLAVANMGLGMDEVAALQVAAGALYNKTLDALLKHDAYNWQGFGHYDGINPAVTAESCAAYVRELCTPKRQAAPFLLDLGRDTSSTEQVLAAFLITRGPHWWLGHGWQGCPVDAPYRPSILDMDVGEPTSMCVETSTGHFKRAYSKVSVELNCEDWTSSITPVSSSSQSPPS